MKKIFCLLAAFALFTGCDDGDMTFKTFDFEDANVEVCGDNTLYKVNGTEVLILNLNPSYLQNAESEPEQFSTDAITYRNYSGTGAGNTLCSEVPSANPTVIDEWNGEGTISIETNAVLDVETGLLAGYDHKIILVDVSFNKGDEVIRILDSDFGTIRTTLGFTFNFEFDEEDGNQPETCDDSNILYKTDANAALLFEFGAAAFPNSTGEIIIDLSNDTDDNTLQLNVYNGSPGLANICDNYALTPQLIEKWTATEGTIKINTTYNTDTGYYDHSIYFDDVKFTNAANEDESFFISDLDDFDETTGYNFGIYNTQ
ncbi:hypothetical protein [Flavobacterium rhizosphaerae]|uniref:Uncharacterized protein n=1 Tax=Flavobacterium rhizosphaerae TaxID=3163298 RepID=A0ABW8YV49_9FLAO